MKKDPKVYLEDIIQSATIIEEYIREAKLTKESFLKDIKTQDAIIRRLEIIGEAVKRLEYDFREQYSKIPWKKMAGLRDIAIHQYDEIDWEQVWITITEKLPQTKQTLESII